MYGEKEPEIQTGARFQTDGLAKQPEHITMAIEVARTIVDKFEPDEQNAILKEMYGYIKQERSNRIDSLRKQLDLLDKSLTEMGK